MKTSAAKSGRSAKIATRPVPPSLLPNCRSRAGTSKSAIPPSPMASWTVWFTTPTASKCAASPCARNTIRHRTKRRNEPKPVSVRCLLDKLAIRPPDDTRSPLQALRRKIAGDVEDQLRDPRRKGIDLSIGAGYDCHVVGDRAIQCVQGGDQRFRFAVRPQRQVAECA